jgi:hypothetical protein
MEERESILYDNSFTIHPEYSKDLFRKMKGTHKRFFCNGNVDVLAEDVELVRLSKEAGCIAWLIGFESVSQQTLDAIEPFFDHLRHDDRLWLVAERQVDMHPSHRARTDHNGHSAPFQAVVDTRGETGVCCAR